MKKCTVIINPVSGKGFNEGLINRIGLVLENYNYISNIIITKYQGHAEEIIKNIIDDDLVISFGGDGTFYEVMNGNLQRKKPLLLSHIPVGTTNDIGYMYGLNKSITANLKLVLDGKVKEIDICSLNKRNFVYVASYGKFMELPYATPQELKHSLGYFAYFLQGVKEFFHKTPQCDITYEIDGIKYNGKYTFVIISNANRIAGINNFYNEVKLDDGKFEVMFCSIRKLSDMIRAFYILKTSDISKVSGIETYKTDNLKLTFNDNLKAWCLDGEKFNIDNNECTFSINKKVKMLIPEKNISKLFNRK